MKYTNAVSFRQALDQHITRVHNEHGLSHTRIRKLIVFDRFLARLLAASPEGWVLKGGVALTLRWGHHARTTKDLDLGRLDDEEAATEHLIAAGTMHLDDFFLDDAHARAASFLQPILDGTVAPDAVWDPGTREWRLGVVTS